ncbi:MAG: glutathione S-transferase family protein [Candidatus Binatus sp.]|uniref:glutathione S-transferase family protein n=1 Tax=Candidatus Binatus sp. TaxID=2811406 RepID=UPI002718A5B8|nr:glutathione S-transferase family protein [Candidatus Binatus sp.]MDO8433209.1 glutathione S-transferase family protein [Candidatus Binatus sp.]
MLKLFEHPFSPYVQKVKIALYEKNLAFEAEVPDAFSGAPTEFGKLNPRLEVPALIDDGFAIFDSTIILDYIEEKWPAPAMLPPSPRERARVRMIEDVCDTYYEAINWGLMEVRAWKRVTGDAARQLESRATLQTAGVFKWLERELGSSDYFNGASFGYGDLSVYPHVHGSVVWGVGPKANTPLARWLSRVEERASVRNTIDAAAQFAGSLDVLPQMLESGAFARQYRDHRLEWIIRSGGVEVVLAGMKNKTIRFSSEVS